MSVLMKLELMVAHFRKEVQLELHKETLFLLWLRVPCFKLQDYIRISSKSFTNGVTLGEFLILL